MENKDFQLDTEQIKTLVEEILAAKEGAELQESVEEILKKATDTIESMTASLEAKDVDLEEKDGEIASMKEELETLKAQIEEKDQKLAELTSSLEEAQTTLAEIEKDRRAAERMTKLEGAKVARTGEAREAQLAKIREMADEDFEEYAAELTSMREALLAEIKDAAGTEETDSGKETENETAEVDEEAELDVAPAEIDEEEGKEAALNMETAANETLHDKYQKMGKALANMIAQIKDE